MNQIKPTLNTSFKIVLSLCCALLILTSCSRKKDTFINRNFHALGTKYNILYNGEIALENGIESVDDAFTDNYWELLPVERMQVSDEIVLPGQTKNQDFERAEEKAIKAVQKHGMNIKGKEYNPQIDEAYLLLGKARYFDQRFIPALEAFNYILYKYPASDKINTAKIWREKTNIRLENNELAIKNIKRLLQQETLEDQDYADANAMLAMAYINIKAKDSALIRLKKAEAYTKKNNQKARYNYISGQLYNEFGYKDSANIAFDRVIELHRKIPRAYYINAQLAKASNFDLENGNLLEFEEYLFALEDNRENRPFLDKIYFHIGEFYRKIEYDSIAKKYYNASLGTKTQDKQLKSNNYQTLGDMSFDNSEYKEAGAYYDSTLTNMVLNSKPYRVVKKKRDNLDDVIRYEAIAQKNDSILYLVNLTEESRLELFTNLVNDLKAKDEEAKEKEEAAKRLNSGLVAFDDKTGKSLKGLEQDNSSNNQSFYFYNSTTVAYGKNEFLKIWGDRELKDNWRLSSTNTNASTSQQEENVIATASDEERYNPEFYISKIPSNQSDIDSIAKERNFAYYQLGLIYKEKFQELELAKSKLQALLKNNPEERLILPTKYNLYKIYVGLNLNDEAENAKNDIITNYPDSRYTELLLNPSLELAKDENSPESLYEKQYEAFTNQEYADVIKNCDIYIRQFEGEIMVPKFEILKASAKGRLYGYEAYKDAVNYIALTYPNSEEGKKAQEIIQYTLPVLAKKDFVDNEIPKNFKVVYQFDINEDKEIIAVKEKLDDAVAKINYYELTTSIDVYDENTKFLVVHGLKSINGALGFAQFLEEKKIKVNRSYFSISSPNYEILQLHKNLNEYIQSQ